MDSISLLISSAVKRNDKKYLAELKQAFNVRIKVKITPEQQLDNALDSIKINLHNRRVIG